MTTYLQPGRNMYWAGKCLHLLLALALLAASLLVTTGPAAAQTCSRSHTVASGETISSIADKYSVTFQEIATANNLKDPYTIFVGQTLCIPGTATTASTSSSSSSTTTSTSTGPDFEIEQEGRLIQLTSSKFPTNTTFYVRAGKGKYRITSWQKIGRIRTAKSGDKEFMLKLPKNMLNAPLVTICVKNVKTDAVLCRSFNLSQ